MPAETTSPPLPYQCPGEKHPISRSVHLGRLARFYPACRDCQFRTDTASLSQRQVEQLATDTRYTTPGARFDQEGVGGTFPNDFGAADVRQLAAAMGIFLRRTLADNVSAPSVVVGSDGRPLTAELLAAAGEGLRLAGCSVVDVGFATAPCLAFAIDHLPADGGLLVGNPNGRPQDAALKLWGPGARPLSRGGGLDAVEATYRAGVNRPVRSYGPIRRFHAEVPYLACLHKYFHALRPLRFVLETVCLPVQKYLAQLSGQVACELIYLGRQSAPPHEIDESAPLSQRVVEAGAHFGLWIDGDGEMCRVVDQHGDRVPAESLFGLVCKHLLHENSRGTVVLEQASTRQLEEELTGLGAVLQRSASTREAMDRQLRDTQAIAGGGPTGRFWYREHQPSADALKTLTLLLRILSQSDQDLSDVVAALTPCT